MARKRFIRARDLYRLETVTYAELSPDGKHVVYAVQQVDPETQKKTAHLWIAPTVGGKPYQFTFGKHVDSSPRWSPDGARIAFLSNRGEATQPQLYILPFGGGEARQLTSLRGDFDSFEWSPDGKSLVCQFRKQDAEVAEREKDEKQKQFGVVARRITRLFYTLDGAGYLPQERWHIWVVDAVTGKARQLTDGEIHDEVSPRWSPDGASIAFFSNRAPDPDREPGLVDLFVIPAAGGELRKLGTPPGEKLTLSWSPDGRTIAYVGQASPKDWWQNDRLWLVPVEGNAPPRCLTAAHDLTFMAATLTDTAEALLMPPVWSHDGTRLYAQASRYGGVGLYAVRVEDGALEPVIAGSEAVGAWSFDAAQTRLAYLRSTFRDPVQVWTLDVASRETWQLTALNAKWLREVTLGEIEEVWFKGPAGNDLQGWILTPPDFDPAQRYPSIMEIHGGPLLQYGYSFMHEFYYLAAQGYVVYFCNPRGGQGYGEAHAKAIWGAWGTVDYDDLMAWADYVAALPYIDPERMGVTGGSYGGYMTAWIIGHTTRFQAAVAQRCVSNLISMWGTSDFNWTFQEPFGDQPPYVSIENLWACSPLRYLGNAKTPTLVMHSERDMRCALEQGQQLFTALKHAGVEAELVIFPEESHGLSRGGRTDRRIARLKHIRRWFDQHLKDEAQG
ncbi:MAG TPA: S9 family peptidase [Anaerolineae bacterium]|nr:S9 family peptidase [Anaerolineae bacterium]